MTQMEQQSTRASSSKLLMQFMKEIRMQYYRALMPRKPRWKQNWTLVMLEKFKSSCLQKLLWVKRSCTHVWVWYSWSSTCVFSRAGSVMQLLLLLLPWVPMCRQRGLSSLAEDRKCSKKGSCAGLPWNAIVWEDQQIKGTQFHSRWFWRPFTPDPWSKS